MITKCWIELLLADPPPANPSGSDLEFVSTGTAQHIVFTGLSKGGGQNGGLGLGLGLGEAAAVA
jgi:hypothetical protein